MKLKVVTGIAIFFLVFIGSGALLILFEDILGHAISSSSISSIFVYKLAISTLYVLCSVLASVAVSSGFIPSSKTKIYFAALVATIVFTTGWLVFRLCILRSYLQDDPNSMPVSFSISIEIVNKIIVNANIFILSLLVLAFGYMWFRHRRKEN